MAKFEPFYRYLILNLQVERVPPPSATDRWVRDVLSKVGIEILDSSHADFESPVPSAFAYTMTYVLSTSHLAIHTAPEHGWVHVAFALCSSDKDMEILRRATLAFFGPKSHHDNQFVSGVEK